MRNKSHPPFIVELMINEKPVTFEVHTGTAVTILSQEVCCKLLFPVLNYSLHQCLLKTGDLVRVLGEVQVDVSYGEQNGKINIPCMWLRVAIHVYWAAIG